MQKNYKNKVIKILYVLFFVVLIFPQINFGQTETNVTKLLEFAKTKREEWKSNRKNVEEKLNKLGYQLRFENIEGRIIEVQKLKNGIPQYYSTDNIDAAKTTRTDKLWSAPFNETGSGYNKLGEWDGGGILTSHQEFGGRVTQEDSPSSTSEHSTHVAGTMIAHGVDPNAKGMAFEGNLKAWDWNDDEAEMATAAANGLEISNHSYGYIRGWTTRFGDKGLGNYWYGDKDVSATEDYGFGFYDTGTKDIDQIAYDAPYYLIVKSAGNDRGENYVGGLSNYWWDSSADDWVKIPAGSEPDRDGGASGYDCIGTKGIAKNILTIAAVKDVANYTGPSSVEMTSFSSWGPSDDGRIKPDISANGDGLYSCSDAGNDKYTTMSGTSMSSPNTSGTLALLQHYYQSNHSNQPMRAATLKALVIHTADEAGNNDGPDYEFGWGLLNAEKAAQVIDKDVSTNNTIDELVLNNGATYTRNVSVDGSEPLVVTIVWTDIPGAPVPDALDPADPMLVNDLDLRITHNGTTYYPWKLDRNNPSAAATNNSENHIDNVEKVEIKNPTSGTYTIEVSHSGTLAKSLAKTDANDQAFSLIVSGDNTPLPVELTSFNVQTVKNSKVELTWKTATEVNNYGFEVERKLNNNWEKIGFVNGYGNSNSPKNYSFIDNNLEGNKFVYRLKQIDIDGTYEFSKEIEIEVIPNKYSLEQNYPNPFNPTTSIRFTLPESTNAKIVVYDVLGKVVKNLLNEKLEAGYHNVNFDASKLGSGLYIYTLETRNFTKVRKMLLLK